MSKKILIFSGFSGSGKGTVLKELKKLAPRFKLSVSMTTRAPREGEKNGREYTFVTREEFEKVIRENGFLEYTEYCGNYYGTPKKQLFDMMEKGRIPVLEIETDGAGQVMAQLEGFTSVFLATPDFATLEKRLRDRGTETEEKILRRLASARKEILDSPKYQHVVLNLPGRQKDAAQAILELVRKGASENPVVVKDRDAFMEHFFNDKQETV